MIEEFDLIPEEILVYYDGPRAFTTKSLKGNLFLAYWMDELEDGDQYLVTPISNEALEALKGNRLAFRDAMNGNIWLVSQTCNGIQSQVASLDEIERSYPGSIPDPGLFLRPISS